MRKNQVNVLHQICSESLDFIWKKSSNLDQYNSIIWTQIFISTSFGFFFLIFALVTSFIRGEAQI